jgi:hypothetical protein
MSKIPSSTGCEQSIVNFKVIFFFLPPACFLTVVVFFGAAGVAVGAGAAFLNMKNI